MGSIFTDVLHGRRAGEVVYTDDQTFAFLDPEGATLGHTVVVSRTEVDHLYDLPASDYAALWDTARRIAAVLDRETSKQRVVMLVGGFGVPHAHVHLIPANSLPEIMGREPVEEPERAQFAQRLRALLDQ